MVTATVTKLSSQQIRHDIALLQLADPILSTHADPFRTDRGATAGHAVSVVSYGQGRNDAPSRQRECQHPRQSRRCSGDVMRCRARVRPAHRSLQCAMVGPGSSQSSLPSDRSRAVMCPLRWISNARWPRRWLPCAAASVSFPPPVTSARRLTVGGERSLAGLDLSNPRAHHCRHAQPCHFCCFRRSDAGRDARSAGREPRPARQSG